MAKKKLTPYEKAQRQFVQTRFAESGKEKSPETRQRFRQRFDTLAAEKEGRTRLAGKLLPGAGTEERRNFKRMLATDLPSRNMTKNDVKEPKPSYSEGITQGFQKAVQSGTYKVPTTAKKTTTTTTSQTTTQTSAKEPNFWQNRRNNIIGQGINFPGRQGLENFLNPLGGSGLPDFSSPSSIAKYVGVEAAEAALVVGSAFPIARVASGTLKVGGVAGRLGIRALTKFSPRLGQQGINKVGGVGKNLYGPTRPASSTGPLALNPGPAQSVTPTVRVPTVRTPRLNTNGGVGGKPYGPNVPSPTPSPAVPRSQKPLQPPPSLKPRPTPPKAKTSPSKSEVERAEANFVKEFGQPKYAAPGQSPKGPTGKAPTSKGPKKSKEQLDDEAYNVAQAKNRFPGSTAKDAPFVAKLNRAQEAIEKKSEGYQNYANWLRNPQTQATIARLKRKK